MVVSRFCASLQSGVLHKLKSVRVQKNKKVLQLCGLLFDLGYIGGYSVLNDQTLLVTFKYTANRSPLRSLVISSRPSSRFYYSRRNLLGRCVNNYFKTNSFTIFFTSKGYMMTDIECFMVGVGGEPLCVVS